MTAKKNKNEEPKVDESIAREETKKPVKREPGFYVKPGRAITSLRGILGPGTKLEPKFFSKGLFDEIKELKTIEEVKK